MRRACLVTLLVLAGLLPARASDIPDEQANGKPAQDSKDKKFNWTMPFPEEKPDDKPPYQQPATPLPGSDQRDQAGRTAQQAEQRLNDMPAPDPKLTGRVANEYLRAGQPDGAERVLDRLIDGGGAGADPYRLRAAARFQKEDWPGTYADATRALSLDPDDKVAADLAGTARMQLERLGLGAPDVKPRQGPSADGGETSGGPPRDLAARDGASPLGLDSVVAPLATAPGYVDPRKAFLSDVDRKLSIGGRPEALLDLARYLDKHPDDLGVRLKRARLLNLDKNPEAAIRDVEQVLKRAPDDPSTLREEAYSLIQLGRAREALEPLDRALRLQPRSALGYLYRAMAREALGDREGAEADYALAARLDPALRRARPGGKEGSRGGSGPTGVWSSGGRLRLGLEVLALPTLLLGLWGALRGAASRTTNKAAATDGEGPAEPASSAPGPGETIAVGTLLGGVYRVGRVLGRGGMGVVFEAEDLALERKVAIKQLRTPEGSAEDLQRFLGEARLVARLQHPNIVQIHTVLEEAGLLYLVFELVDGRGLDSILAERGRLPLEEAREVLRDVCAALDCAHEARIIHRDLKPSNVMRTVKGVHKVMDFGIAHQARGDAQTRTGAWGTPPYMPPEQERGLVSRESDLYALGCTAYELLAGARPFGAGDDKLTPRFAPLSSMVPGLPPALDAFMLRALAPDPAARFHAGAEMLAAFDAALSAERSALASAPRPRPGRPPRGSWRRG